MLVKDISLPSQNLRADAVLKLETQFIQYQIHVVFASPNFLIMLFDPQGVKPKDV